MEDVKCGTPNRVTEKAVQLECGTWIPLSIVSHFNVVEDEFRGACYESINIPTWFAIKENLK